MCEKILFMDVYGLIYERGLIGALKYANTIEVSNPSLATSIDSTVERLIVLSGENVKKSFVKCLQFLHIFCGSPLKANIGTR